jgi:hypothetical protein
MPSASQGDAANGEKALCDSFTITTNADQDRRLRGRAFDDKSSYGLFFGKGLIFSKKFVD